MNRSLRIVALLGPWAGAALAGWLMVAPVRADVVERRDGTRFEGTVVSVDATSVTLEAASGTTRIPRADVASISFSSVKPVKVEVRNVKSDDALDVLVDGDTVIREARDGGDWIDITPRLKDGNTSLRLRIRNERGSWSYRFHVRINGQVFPVACGQPPAEGCACCGKTGREIGTIEDLPEIWIHVDRALGRAEILP